jgi:hypothetical protein
LLTAQDARLPLRKALSDVSGLDVASPEVSMMAAIVDNVFCQPEFLRAIYRGYGGFEVTWTKKPGIQVKWHQMSFFEVVN